MTSQRRSGSRLTRTADDLPSATTPAARDFQVAISDQQQAVAVDPDWLIEIAETALQNEGITSAELSIALVDDPTIHDINRQFLNHDDPTDVISFLLNDPVEGAAPRHIDGEVVISGETARRCAEEIDCEPRHELAHYLVHGLLHLCGYDDHSPADRQQMQERERHHLQNLGLTPHYDY